MMSLLRLPCCASTSNFCVRTPKSPPILKPFNLTNHITNSVSRSNNSSVSGSFSHSLTFWIRPGKKTSHFVLHFSAETQELVSNTQEEKQVEEEYSKTRLLASNVPWSSSAEDIRTLFGKFGTVVDVELSMHDKTRNRGLAFVEMGSPEEALAAFNNLDSFEFEGRKLKMLYAKPKKTKPLPPPRPNPGPTFNLFVANLPFQARAKDIKDFFTEEGANLVSADIVYHDNPRRSSGYGFVAFKTKKEADEALSTFEGKEFMGRPLRVARSKQFVKPQIKEDLQSSDAKADLQESVEPADVADLQESVEPVDVAD